MKVVKADQEASTEPLTWRRGKIGSHDILAGHCDADIASERGWNCT